MSKTLTLTLTLRSDNDDTLREFAEIRKRDGTVHAVGLAAVTASIMGASDDDDDVTIDVTLTGE
jgi:hypothetical protein